ncbi:uncharacterized protein L969DRAFT_25411 [Mixia osmundae IAM 14324]|uniref:Uncharacterized protein n=1 Tax=Mixia osmundae (strain CBS 9802 / IAM 14324 / JCM 22182 / KY 12970) TaxID=764103 RepID=G7DS84_MIXOS|nr:uncharacterized protein L969DRAFT_25411 [Mixia osmundae IAM 14324]KEI37502.1 hypothetical protein L969DRAFT_25411 [Mixia osmundae IAM 14324]GAA93444.1 hypothetical protein E5Q_00085 [Mixia osmundae IAM 14324]
MDPLARTVGMFQYARPSAHAPIAVTATRADSAKGPLISSADPAADRTVDSPTIQQPARGSSVRSRGCEQTAQNSLSSPARVETASPLKQDSLTCTTNAAKHDAPASSIESTSDTRILHVLPNSTPAQAPTGKKLCDAATTAKASLSPSPGMRTNSPAYTKVVARPTRSVDFLRAWLGQEGLNLLCAQGRQDDSGKPSDIATVEHINRIFATAHLLSSGIQQASEDAERLQGVIDERNDRLEQLQHTIGKVKQLANAKFTALSNSISILQSEGQKRYAALATACQSWKEQAQMHDVGSLRVEIRAALQDWRDNREKQRRSTIEALILVKELEAERVQRDNVLAIVRKELEDKSGQLAEAHHKLATFEQQLMRMCEQTAASAEAHQLSHASGLVKMNELVAVSQRCQREVAAIMVEKVTLEHSFDECRTKLLEQIACNQAQREQLDAANVMLDETHQRVRTAEDRATSIEEEHNRCQQVLNAAEVNSRELREKLGNVQGEVADGRKALQAAEVAAESAKAASKTEVKRQHSQISSLKASLEAAETCRERSQQELEVAKVELQTESQNAQTIRELLSARDADIESCHHKILLLEAHCQKQETQIEALNQQHAEADRAWQASFDEAHESFAASLCQRDAAAKAVELQVSESSPVLQEESAETRELKSRYVAKERELEALTSEQTAHRDRLEKERRAHQEEVSKVVALDGTVKKLTTELMEARREAQDAVAKLARITRESDRASTDSTGNISLEKVRTTAFHAGQSMAAKTIAQKDNELKRANNRAKAAEDRMELMSTELNRARGRPMILQDSSNQSTTSAPISSSPQPADKAHANTTRATFQSVNMRAVLESNSLEVAKADGERAACSRPPKKPRSSQPHDRVPRSPASPRRSSKPAVVTDYARKSRGAAQKGQ